jgi:hypothetical protein
MKAINDTLLSELEVSLASERAIKELALRTIADLLATPSRAFMESAGDFQSVHELQSILADIGVDYASTPFGQPIPEEDRVYGMRD